MKSLLIATLIAGSALTGVASASPSFDWEGTCRFASVNDTTPGGWLGAEDSWTGEANLQVIPTDATTGLPSGAAATVECVIRINGTNDQTVLTGSGTGVVVAAGRVTFTAAVTDVIELCTRVTVGSETITRCAFYDDQFCPTLVCGPGGLLEQAFTVVGQLQTLDPVICAQLIAVAPTVDSLPTANILYIDPATGDTYAGGTTPDYLFWDCPPYVI